MPTRSNTSNRRSAPTPAPAKAPRKPVAKPVAKAAAAAVTPPAPAPAADRPEKLKLVRDSFTIPQAEHAAMGALKQRCLKLGHHAKKSELLRAGLKLLSTLDDAALLAAVAAVPPLKTGRPKAEKADKAEKAAKAGKPEPGETPKKHKPAKDKAARKA